VVTNVLFPATSTLVRVSVHDPVQYEKYIFSSVIPILVSIVQVRISLSKSKHNLVMVLYSIYFKVTCFGLYSDPYF